jgi:ATP-binding cassette subfamily A (ABC1) protein 3
MFSSRQGPQWRRIYRQTLTLTYKNLLLFYKAPIATLIRALIFPIVITVVLCLLKHISEGALYDAKAGIAASSRPVKSLSDAVSSVTTQRLVFVLNGNSNQTVVPVIQDIVQQSGLTEPNVRILDNPDDLFDVCKQTIQGTSVCYAAVIFLSFNDTNVDYILAIDENVAFNSHFDFQSHESLLTNRLLPLQWAIDSSLGNFTRIPMPLEQPWYGYIGTFTSQPPLPTSYYWLDLVQQFVAPLFILILVGIVFHLSTFVAMERQSLVADLMAAQMVTTVPRILSTILSFLIIYIPGFVACSILLSQVLFTGTSDGILVLLTLLAGISMAVSTHFVASFFSKAAIAGLYSSVLAVALALITLAATLSSNPPAGQILALALIFPPATWATLMGDIARIEYIATPFTLSGTTVQESSFQGYLYIVFFIVQIILYSLGTYFLETKFWRVTRKFDRLDASSDVALRCTNLSKTYNGRRWRWPFTGKQSVVVAVDSLDLEVKKGSVTFLLGPNGGGKTTTLRCVAGMTGIDVGSHIEINEGGLVFGICPQTNVSCKPFISWFSCSGRTIRSREAPQNDYNSLSYPMISSP